MTVKFKGLSEEDVLKSRENHGSNLLAKEKHKGFIQKFFENLSDPIIRILLIALALQVIFSLGNINFIETGGILAAVLISATVSTISEFRSEKAFDALNADIECSRVRVLRDERMISVQISELVVGDIVYLNSGEKIHADGVILEGKISVDQSALNGESRECTKCPGKDEAWELSSSCKVFRGTMVTSGSAIMKVGRVGEKTFYGMVAKDVQTETRISPLKLRLGKLAKDISRIGYIVAVAVGVAFLFNAFVVDNSFVGKKILESLTDPRYLFTTLLRALTLMITVVVVAAPEGLPMMITVVLSANMKKMLKDKVLVKKLVGIETAGSLNILFTDKTGTLTVGKPECERIVCHSGSYKTLASLKESGEIYNLLLICAKYNTDVLSVNGEKAGGNATDRAIFDFFGEAKTPDCEIKKKVPFSSEIKFSSVTLADGREIIKGAPEVILASCKTIVTESGEAAPIESERFLKEYHKSAERAERVICVAVSNGRGSYSLVGLVMMKDKIRKGVDEALKEINRAGIQVVMITGDGKETACAVGHECGVYNPMLGHVALTSDELHSMNDDEVKSVIPKLRVVSRALPQDKTRLVRLSQELDLVVGMTGDGVNDAPSLKLTDVGFAMGSGTDIAKNAADVVILDNSLLAIGKTVLYGRTIFKSITKFIIFQLTMNFAACGISLVGQFIGVDTPITIIQMLWVNIIMDTLGGLAFAGEAPMKYYMKEKPKRRDEPLLSGDMLRRIICTGAYTLVLCIVFLTSYIFKDMYESVYSKDRLYTAFYALFIFAGIFNCFCARSERVRLLTNITKNKSFLLIMSVISIIQIFMIYYGGVAFRCTPLTAKELMFAVSVAFTVIPFDTARRVVKKIK